MKNLSPTESNLFLCLSDSPLPNSDDFLEEAHRAQTFLDLLHKVIKKHPMVFDNDLFKSYQNFLAFSDKDFRTHRTLHHQLRIICYHYIMRKHILRLQRLSPTPLSLEFHLVPAQLQFLFNQKSVLGIAIVIRTSSCYERFEDTHIVHAIQKLLPDVIPLKESFLSFQKPRDSCRLLYLEVQKPSESLLSLQELSLVKKNLKEELKKHIETLNPSIFGICNVEENLRNIFTLSQELITSSDLAQVMISLEKALETVLVFRIILVRALKKNSPVLSESFHKFKDSVEYIHERSSVIGYLEPDGLPKEAVTFRLEISKELFLLRSDSSFNIFRARQYVFSLLQQALGDLRDYNGGIFSKQQELLLQFRQQFKAVAEKDPELLEDFFHGLRPIEMQAIIPLSSLVHLFKLFLQVQEEDAADDREPFLKMHQEGAILFAVIHFHDSTLQERLTEALDSEQFSKELTTWFHLKDHKGFALGYIYHSSSNEKRELFQRILEKSLQSWVSETQKIQILRLTPQHLPVSLDPRLGGDDISVTVLKLLFEGLMRIGKDGNLHFALTKELTISKDGKTYTFILKKSQWTNGDSVTAHDFCYTWKKILSPNFNSAFACFFFYPILNAKKAKEGRVSMNTVGIRAVDDITLVVQLENPCPYFLELVSHPFYSPVNHRVDRSQPNWPLQTGRSYVCNGPFFLTESTRQESYELRKNSFYWDKSEVKLDCIQIYRASGRQSLELFRKGETDWLGRPLSAWEPFFTQGASIPIEKGPMTNTYWYVFNVKEFPFHSPKIRQALSLAIDRQALINQLNLQAIPAFTPLPIFHTQFPNASLKRKAPNAGAFFEKALQELGMTRKHFPTITLVHPNNEFRKKTAQVITQQWKEKLGISIKTESYSFKDLFAKMSRGDYQIGVTAWKPWIDDPIYTLNAFKYADEGINYSKWEHDGYKQLLDRATKELSLEKRSYLYAKAEAILIREVPVIPVVYEPNLFLRQTYVEGVSPFKIGGIDFKNAEIINRR